MSLPSPFPDEYTQPEFSPVRPLDKELLNYTMRRLLQQEVFQATYQEQVAPIPDATELPSAFVAKWLETAPPTEREKSYRWEFTPRFDDDYWSQKRFSGPKALFDPALLSEPPVGPGARPAEEGLLLPSYSLETQVTIGIGDEAEVVRNDQVEVTPIERGGDWVQLAQQCLDSIYLGLLSRDDVTCVLPLSRVAPWAWSELWLQGCVNHMQQQLEANGYRVLVQRLYTKVVALWVTRP